MADYESDILNGMQVAQTGILIEEEVPQDPVSKAVFMEAFECYQDADVVFQEKCDELVYHDPKLEEFSDGSPNKQHNFLILAKESGFEILRERMLQRQGIAQSMLTNLLSENRKVSELENNVRIKEGIVRASSARMFASMNITRDKDIAIRDLDIEQNGYDRDPANIEHKVAKQIQQAAQRQTIIAAKDLIETLEGYQQAQDALIPLELQSRTASIVAYTAKYVTENASFCQKRPG